MKQLTRPLKAALVPDDPQIAVYQLIHIIGTTVVVVSATFSNARREQSDFRNKASALFLKPLSVSWSLSERE